MTIRSTPKTKLRVLVLGSSAAAQGELLAALRGLGTVQVVRSVDDALSACAGETFDLVVGDAESVAALSQVAGQQQAEAIVDGIGQGVCVVSRDGRLLSANARLRAYPEHVVDAVRQRCAELCAQLAADEASTATGGAGPVAPVRTTRRSHLELAGEYAFDIVAAPVADSAGNVLRAVALVTDASAGRRLRDKINAIDRAGAELVSLDTQAIAELDVGERLALLEEKIIRYSRDLMHFDHFCVRVLDRASNRLDTVLAGGMSEQAKSLPIYVGSEGNGISGYVAATGRSYISPDVTRDPRYLPGIDNARSSLTVPLRLHDQIVGILNVESERTAAFSEDDRQFAEIFARYIAIALHILQLLAVERSTTTGQIASDVSAELSGPLNDIVASAASLIEDYIGHDDLRHRLNAIIDHVDRVKRTIQAMTDRSGITGLRPEGSHVDPVIAGKRILVADDEDIIRDTITELLTRCGAIVSAASGGAEALALVRSRPFDLVLTDIRMPEANGYEIFSAVKASNPDCPVILITGFGYDPNHSIVRASREGLAAVLFKPFKVEQLLEDVRHALTANVI